MKIKSVILSIVAAVLLAVSPVSMSYAKNIEEMTQEEKDSFLMLMPLMGDGETAKALLDAGANPNAARKDGSTTVLIEAVKNENVAVIKELLAAGANPDMKESRHGLTALMLAAGKGNAEIVKMLLSALANVNLESNDKTTVFTALSAAVSFGNPQIVKLLLDAGANSNPKDMVMAMLGLSRAETHEKVQEFEQVLEILKSELHKR